MFEGNQSANRSASQFYSLGVSAKATEGKALTNSLRQRLEIMTKTFNSINSENIKIRGQINAFRKERTLYDKVFKELEQQIRVGEAKMIRILKKNNAVDGELAAAAAKTESVMESLEQSQGGEDFMAIIMERKRNYDMNLQNAVDYSRKSMMVNLQRPDVVCEPEDGKMSVSKKELKSWVGESRKVQPVTAKSIRRIAFQEEGPRSGKVAAGEGVSPAERRIGVIERLVNEFKLYTEENEFLEAKGALMVSQESVGIKRTELQTLTNEVL